MKGFALVSLLVVLVAGNALADPLCDTVDINAQGTSDADITVDSTSGGVTVMAASVTRCGALIINSGAAAMRCGPTSMTISSTKGAYIAEGGVLVLGVEGRQAWRCIRTSGTSTSANVVEAIQ